MYHSFYNFVMNVLQIVANDIPTLHYDDSVATALDVMEQFNIQHLALCDDKGIYVGLISYELLTSISIPDSLRHFSNAPLFRPAVNEQSFPYKALELMAHHNLSIVPIIDDAQKLLASVNEADLLQFLIKNSGLVHKGGIIVLHIKPYNYSLTEIARICESNDVLILNVQLKELKDQEFMQIILKTNTKDLAAVMATFERYEYEAFAFGTDVINADNYKQRFEMLMKFLNI
jgi:acetoin utilization protein AcuB